MKTRPTPRPFARASFDEEGMAVRALGAGQTATITARDASGTACRVFLGGRMTRHVALQTGCFKPSRLAFDAAAVTAGAARIGAAGKCESGPVTRAQDCAGTRGSAQPIACPRPRRQVELEVAGTR